MIIHSSCLYQIWRLPCLKLDLECFGWFSVSLDIHCLWTFNIVKIKLSRSWQEELCHPVAIELYRNHNLCRIKRFVFGWKFCLANWILQSESRPFDYTQCWGLILTVLSILLSRLESPFFKVLGQYLLINIHFPHFELWNLIPIVLPAMPGIFWENNFTASVCVFWRALEI